MENSVPLEWYAVRYGMVWAVSNEPLSPGPTATHPRLRGARPRGAAGYGRGATANLKLTFHLDHSVGADHLHVQGSGGNHLAGGNQCD